MPITCTPDALSALAKCFTGLSAKKLQEIQTYLLCQAANGGGGGGVYTADEITLQLLGTEFSVLDAELLALASVTSANNKLFYFTGAGTGAVTDFTATARTLLDDASTTAMLTTLGGGAPTGSGVLVLATAPTLVTPVLGVASATTINKVTITAPATGSTLTVADGKTLTANSSLTLAGTDGTTMTFPATSATIARTDAANTFTGIQTFNDRIIGAVNGALSAPAETLIGTWITGGTATTTKPMFLIEPTGTTSTAWSTSGTGIGVNAASGFVGRMIELQLNGSQLFFVNFAGACVAATFSGNAFSATANTGVFNIGSSSDVILGRQAAANLRQGSADAAAPVAQTFSVQNVVAGTTDTAGAARTIAGSRGTGTGAGGSILFTVATAGSTGSTQNALVTALTIASDLSSTFAGVIIAPAGTTAVSGFRLTAGVAPTSPVNGDMWQDGTDLKIRVGGVTKTVTLT